MVELPELAEGAIQPAISSCHVGHGAGARSPADHPGMTHQVFDSRSGSPVEGTTGPRPSAGGDACSRDD
jgi:hypothetical protein